MFYTNLSEELYVYGYYCSQCARKLSIRDPEDIEEEEKIVLHSCPALEEYILEYETFLSK
jgi:hypothetical protein